MSGIVPGDVLVAMNGKAIECASDADVVLEQLSVGTW
jgi:S1-C subfamily serine protease